MNRVRRGSKPMLPARSYPSLRTRPSALHVTIRREFRSWKAPTKQDRKFSGARTAWREPARCTLYFLKPTRFIASPIEVSPRSDCEDVECAVLLGLRRWPVLGVDFFFAFLGAVAFRTVNSCRFRTFTVLVCVRITGGMSKTLKTIGSTTFGDLVSPDLSARSLMSWAQSPKSRTAAKMADG